MNEHVREEIITRVTDILHQHNVSRVGQRVKIIVEIESAPPVVVEEVKKGDTSHVNFEALAMKIEEHMSRVRMTNALAQMQRNGENIRLLSLDQILKYRNLGKHTLRRYMKVLIAAGIHCKWMNELAFDDCGSMSFLEFKISERCRVTLANHNMEFVKDLWGKSIQDLLAKKFPKRVIRELQEQLLIRGIDLPLSDE